MRTSSQKWMVMNCSITPSLRMRLTRSIRADLANCGLPSLMDCIFFIAAAGLPTKLTQLAWLISIPFSVCRVLSPCCHCRSTIASSWQWISCSNFQPTIPAIASKNGWTFVRWASSKAEAWWKGPRATSWWLEKAVSCILEAPPRNWRSRFRQRYHSLNRWST